MQGLKSLSLIFLVLYLAACTSNKVKISGQIEGLDSQTETLYLEEIDIQKTIPIDSVTLSKAGKFSFKFNLESPSFYQLRLGSDLMSLIVYPKDKIKISGQQKGLSKNYEVEGSLESKLAKEINLHLFDTRAQINQLKIKYSQLIEDKVTAETLIPIENAYDSILKAQRKYNISFILENKNRLVSIIALYQEIDGQLILNKNKDIQFYKILSDTLDLYFPEIKHVEVLRKNTASFISKYNTQRLLNSVENISQRLPDIHLPDPKGDTISLSDLTGKLVLLNYWASWDKVSIAHNLKLKSIYDKYHSKGFEIYSISLDSTIQDWTRAINYDEYKWINVSEMSFPMSYASQLYNIQKLPTWFLLDVQQQDIIATDKSYNELDAILQQNLK